MFFKKFLPTLVIADSVPRSIMNGFPKIQIVQFIIQDSEFLIILPRVILANLPSIHHNNGTATISGAIIVWAAGAFVAPTCSNWPMK